jgi:membrane fusion protein, adhesin transport system
LPDVLLTGIGERPARTGANQETILSSPFSRTTRSLAKDTSKLALVIWLFAGVLLALWLGWFFLGRVTLFELSRSARLEVQQSAHPVAAALASKIVVNALVLGQEVQAGDVLVELDASTEVLRLREEESRLKSFAPRIASLNREIAALELARGMDQQSATAATQSARFRTAEASAAVDFAQDNERRLRLESALGSASQIETLRATSETQKLSAARSALDTDARRLQSDEQTRGHQHQAQVENLRRLVVSLEGERGTADVTIARLKQEIDRHLVRAPIAGVVGDVLPLRAGAYVAEGQKLATVIPRGGLIIVAEFTPAAVFGRVHPGQMARMRLDGFPWAEFGTVEARVTRVATEIRDHLVRVELTPIASPASSRIALQHGLSGAIEVQLEQLSPARLILRAAGQLSSDARPASSQPEQNL